jgi:hypothetical protein
MLPPIPLDSVARVDGCGAQACRPCRKTPKSGCCFGAPSARPDPQALYPAATAGRGANASVHWHGAVDIGGVTTPCLPPLRLVFPALLRPFPERPAQPSPPPLHSPSGGWGSGDSDGMQSLAVSAGPVASWALLSLPKKRPAAMAAAEDSPRARACLHTGGAGQGGGDSDGGQMDGGPSCGDVCDPVWRALAAAAADAWRCRAVVAAAGGGLGCLGGQCPFAAGCTGRSDCDSTASRCWARLAAPQERQPGAAPGDGGSAASGGGAPGTGGSAFEPVRRPPARDPPRHAMLGAASGTLGAGAAGAPPSAFRVVRLSAGLRPPS